MTQHVLYLGLDPVNYKTDGKLTHHPLIEIIPRSPSDFQAHCSPETFSAFTHLIITSKSSVNILKDYISLSAWNTKKTIAVGQGTARALQEIGISPFLVAKEETAEGIVELLQTEDLSKAFVFWPHAAGARPLIANYLHGKRITYRECTLYDTKLCEVREKLNLDLFNEIVFTSPTTVEAFIKNYGKLPQNKTLTPIGPVTKNHLQTRMEDLS
jgi:uroporphyrinogen-III synthase